LYRRFLAGEEAGFEELVALYRKGLVRYLNGFVNDWREAEDLALDAFAELAIGTNYRGGSSLKTYLFAIGRHLALRHVKRYGHADNILMDEILEEIGGDENAVEADYLRAEQKERLHAAIRTLKPEYREVLYLVSFEDMSYAEAGKTMRKTEKQIANLTHRAKASLKKILDDAGARIP
jgi:RNA polymerase sigma-70 factor (ECF subfamily)